MTQPAQLSQDQIDRINAELAAGSKIGAIKLYRDYTGRDLAAAKREIEALLALLVQQDPARYAKAATPASSTGCAIVLASLAALGLVLWFLLLRR
jgi:ribosomal protein L7/L12